MSDGKDPLVYWMERASLLQREINAICNSLGVSASPAIMTKIGDDVAAHESRVRLGLVLLRIKELQDKAFLYNLAMMNHDK